MPHTPIPGPELESRLIRLCRVMDREHPDWHMVILDNKIDLYYFTGTMPDGLLIITPTEAILFVRMSYECSCGESNFRDIRPMKSFADVRESFQEIPDKVFVNAGALTLKKLLMLKKHLGFSEAVHVDKTLSGLRSVKSGYELECMRQAGKVHREVTENAVPGLLREGMSEARLCAEVCALLLDHGAMGISRFNSSAAEDVLGVASFGENSLRPSAMDTPSGTVGTSIAMKSIGSCEKRLEPGELILMDIPCGFRGYHTDKSITYFFGELDRHPQRDLIRAAREQCVELEQEAAKLLIPGAVPEEVYEKLCTRIDPAFREGFMNGRRFAGHSIGLTMDETPVLAKGFREPISEGMTFAVEPKIAIPGVGLVGSENTYEVVSDGPAQPLTGSCDTRFEINL